MRIALIAGPCVPPRFAQGLGLPYLAAVLEDAGFEVAIRDLYPLPREGDDEAALDERLAASIAEDRPAIVGMTIHTPAYVERVRLARSLRQYMPDALLVAGGHHPSSEPAHLLRNSDFDVCAIGEAEQTLLEIAQHVVKSRDRGTGDWLRGIRGIVYKHEGRTVRTGRRAPVADLDALPFPAHHLLGLPDYAPHPNLGIKSTALVTYRGCPMGCAFCCNPQGSRVRQRSPERVADEMMRVAADFGVCGFMVYDNLFGLDRQHTLAVCEEIIRRRLDVVWDCWTAGDLVDAELAGRMKAAGCVRVGFGAESGDDAVLATVRRGFTATQHRAGLRAIKAGGLKVQAFFMLGLPGESEDSVRRTVEFAKRCGADEVCLGVYRPYPGTAVWRNPKAFGVRVVRGPNFEAYIETEGLSRSAILDRTQSAEEELGQGGVKTDVLRCDRYGWE